MRFDSSPTASTLIARCKRLLLEPSLEWGVIDAEPMHVAGIFRSWVMPLAAIPAVCGAIGTILIGGAILPAIVLALLVYGLALLGVLVASWVIDKLAPRFGGTSSMIQATKVAAYSGTASWLAGIFQLIPFLSLLGILGLYSLILLWVGLPKLMRVSSDKALLYFLSVLLVVILLQLLIGAVTSPLLFLLVAEPIGPSLLAPR